MNKSRKMLLGFVCVSCLGLCACQSKTTGKSSENSPSTALNSTTTTQSIEKEDPAVREIDIERMLELFGRDFINYDSIDERNERVRVYMTDEAIKENGMNTKVHAGIIAEGQIEGIYKNLLADDEYMITGIEKANEIARYITIKVSVVQDEKGNYKVSKLKVFYIQSAY